MQMLQRLSELINGTEATPMALYQFSQDKFSWTIGTKVMVVRNEIMVECRIKQMILTGKKPSYCDRIKVIFDGIIKELYRFEIQSHPTYIENRNKLTSYCTVDKYDTITDKWIPSYITKLTKTKKTVHNNLFSVYGNNNTYSQWSNEIKCCSLLLQLGTHSNIFVFDISINQWCIGMIVYVETFKQYDLNIYTVFYRKERKIYQQYVHQFSSRIALMTESCEHNQILISDDGTSNLDKRYFQQCTNIIKGFIRQTFIELNSFGDNELVFMLQKYVGCIYGLVINIESKTWLSAIKRRNEMLMAKHETIHNEYLSLYEKGSLFSIKHTANKSKPQLNANAQSFVPAQIKITKKQKCNSPYKSEYVQHIQKRMRIPRRLTETMCSYTKEKIINPYYYILIMVALQFQFMNAYNKISIFNVYLHDKYAGNILYAVAKRQNLHGYEWKMMDILYSAAEINNEFGNEMFLPQTITFLYTDYDNLMSILSDRKQFIQIINNTNWCKIKVYHRINNQNRLEFKVTKKFF
eukprot:493478_1